MLAQPRTAAIILAGGQSSRMGADKASLTVNGRSMLAGVAQAITDVIDGPVIVVGRASRSCRLLADLKPSPRWAWDFTCIDDARGASGPVDALRVGSRALVSRYPAIDRILVSPCDLPTINGDAIADLLALVATDERAERSDTSVASVVRIDGRPQWLSAVLDRPIIDRLAASPIGSEPQRMFEVFSDATCQWYDDVDGRFADADSPGDLSKLTIDVADVPALASAS